jgi:protein phosphatase
MVKPAPGFTEGKPGSPRLRVGHAQDVGRVRGHNEDVLLAITGALEGLLAQPIFGLFIVADGMGGHAAGEVASEMAVQIVSRELGDLRDVSGNEPRDRMAASIQNANRAIYERTIAESDKQGMGTTVSVLMLADSGRWLIGQVGDSRIYLLRDGALTQITKDHSYVQEQVDAGLLTPEQARYHPYSNVITRCVGAGEEVEADTFQGDFRPGDVFLVASDGLTGMVDDRRLQQLLLSRASAGRIVDALIAEANYRGGLDNITAIVVQVVSVGGTGSSDEPTEESPALPDAPSGP